ncbi:SAM-dependent chlorinase/fluorinase [bacterium]|nr:SAM-dependent chlorinase/fluorinase [bacterium]
MSHTFHGRDIFAPAAAHLAAGVDLSRFGPPAGELFQLPPPALEVNDKHLIGEITHIDHFGNLVTSIGWLRHVDEERLLLEPITAMQSAALSFHADNVMVRVHNETIYGVRRSFHEGARGELMAHVDSNNYLEVAINQGNAAQRLNAAVGDVVEMRISSEDDDETSDASAADGDMAVS